MFMQTTTMGSETDSMGAQEGNLYLEVLPLTSVGGCEPE
jgi:hypothetical protein